MTSKQHAHRNVHLNDIRMLLHLCQMLEWYNVQACECDLLYRTITQFSFFCCFRAMAYIRLAN